MNLAREGMEIPTQWKHDPWLRDNDRRTVRIYLQMNGGGVPPFWNLSESEFKRLYKSK